MYRLLKRVPSYSIKSTTTPITLLVCCTCYTIINIIKKQYYKPISGCRRKNPTPLQIVAVNSKKTKNSKIKIY